MGDSDFREKLRKLDAENRKRMNDLLKQEALEKESLYRANPNSEPQDFPEMDEEWIEDDDDDVSEEVCLTQPETKSQPKEEVKLTPPQPKEEAKPQPSTTKKKRKSIMIIVFDDVVDWLDWKKDDGYSISAMCYKILKRAMEADAAWYEYKNNNL
jgi:hypothetical protein